MEQSQGAPAQTSADQGQQQQQANQMPSLDDVISSFNNNPDGIEKQTTNPEQPIQDVQQDLDQAQQQQNPETAQFEQLKKQELELWKMKKEFKEERESFRKEREDKGESHTDFEETLNNLLSNPEDREQEDAPESFDREEYKRQIMDEMREEFNSNRETEREDQETQTVIDDYVSEAMEFTKGRVEEFPILDGMGRHEMVYEAIQQTYDENARLYGHEKAAEMIPTMEQAALHVEKSLASELEEVLKSESVRGYVQKMLGMKQGTPENNTQSINSQQSQGQNTLTNSGYTTHSTGAKDSAMMNDVEAFEHALSFVTTD